MISTTGDRINGYGSQSQNSTIEPQSNDAKLTSHGNCTGNWGDERDCDEVHWHAHTRGVPWGLPKVVGTVQQVYCSLRRLLRRGLEFHVCTINKSAHTKKNLETYLMILVYIYIYIVLNIGRGCPRGVYIYTYIVLNIGWGCPRGVYISDMYIYIYILTDFFLKKEY